MGIVANHLTDMSADDRYKRLLRFQRAHRAYEGYLPNPLKVKVGEPDDNTKVNFSRVIVDKGVSFLFGRGIEFEIAKPGDTPPDVEGDAPDQVEDDAELWLNAAWRANKKQARLQAIALNGGIFGHPFVKIVPAMPYPRIVVLDPSTVDVDWDVEDLEKVIRFTITYAARDPYTRKMVNVRQIVERVSAANAPDSWTVTDQRNDPDGSEDDWTTTATTKWPYAWPPIVHCQNLPAPNEFWGISDLEDDVLSINHTANFVLSNLSKIIRYHAHPKTWGTGFDPADVYLGVNDIVALPDGSTLQNLEAQGDINASLDFYNKLREAIHELTRIPEVATGKVDNVGQLSGVALEILYQPLLEKTETKRQLYGDMLVELNAHLLELGGFGPDIETEIHWPEVLPSDPLVERQALQLDKGFGVSDDTILEKLGYDPDLERQKKALEPAPPPPPIAPVSQNPADQVSAGQE
jgi:hypothetical protein